MIKLLTIAGAGVSLLIALMGCSVGMAMSGKEEPNLGAFRVGSSRGEVELQLGSPISSVTNPDGTRSDVYEYELGNKPSAGRAAAHGVMDVLTLGLWEVVGTPIEAFQGETRRLVILYDATDRVAAINQAAVPVSGHAGGSAQAPGAPVVRATQDSTTDGRTQALVERNNSNLLRLRVGMSQTEVQALMGDPESSEGYAWGVAWLYRTAMPTNGQGSPETAWTPIVFNDQATLMGWGRQVLADQRQR